jgi:hypothetical protein
MTEKPFRTTATSSTPGLLIYDYTVPSNTTTHDFDITLDGNTDNGYWLEIVLDNPLPPPTFISLVLKIGVDGGSIVNKGFCANTRTLSWSGGSAITQDRSDYLLIAAQSHPSSTGLGLVHIPFSKTGIQRPIISKLPRTLDGSDDIYIVKDYQYLPIATSENITGLGLYSTPANGLGAGSTIRLFKDAGYGWR